LPRPLLPAIVRASIGFLLGLGLWAGFSGTYATFVAATAQPLLRMMERPPVTRLTAEEETIVVNREDFPRSSPRPQIRVDELTFNVILLAVLFASNVPSLSTRNVTAFLIACLILAVTHVLAFVAAVESIYALRLGPWSAAHYGPIARNFWSGAAHFYRIAGMFGIAFLLWWMARPPAPAVATTAPARSARRRRKPAANRARRRS
jgi:glycerol uptake facilitator-like aquaporin